jgi:hypothetical protein
VTCLQHSPTFGSADASIIYIYMAMSICRGGPWSRPLTSQLLICQLLRVISFWNDGKFCDKWTVTVCSKLLHWKQLIFWEDTKQFITKGI